VLEIDGASNNSVDDVRELREVVRYVPTEGTYKIYIIDEVHMLSTAAFNALLKTLEEPPSHVVFVFATTDVSRTGFELPLEYPVDALRIILNVEAAAAFDELTRSGRDDLLVRQVKRAWPNVFRTSRLVPAVEYVQANRVRTMLMGAMATVMDGIDLFITPSYGGSVLLTTNLTGHPAVTVPNGFTDEGTPVSISFIGRLYGESELLAAARAYQELTGFHRRRPPEFS